MPRGDTRVPGDIRVKSSASSARRRPVNCPSLGGNHPFTVESYSPTSARDSATVNYEPSQNDEARIYPPSGDNPKPVSDQRPVTNPQSSVAGDPNLDEMLVIRSQNRRTIIHFSV